MILLSDISASLVNMGKKRFYVPAAIALIILFFHPVIFSDKTLFFRDLHRWFYPMKYFLASSLQKGAVPFWCSNYFCGSPFVSDLQSGVFYPLSLILLFGPVDKAFNLYAVIHILLGFVFFYSLIREMGLTPRTALFAGISYCFGGYVLSSVNTLNNLTTLIWLPAVLWSVTKALSNKSVSGYFLTTVFSCMAILGGEPQLYLMSMALLLLYCLFYADQGRTVKYSVQTLIFIFIIISASIMITFIQLAPAYMDYQLSVRSGGIPYAEATSHSLKPGALKHFLIPLKFTSDYILNADSLNNSMAKNGQFPWLLTIYPGVMILPFALFGIIFNYSKKTLFWLVIFLSSTTLALGHYTPLYHLLYKIIPVFRYPEKFIFLASFSLVILSAYGFEKFLLLPKKKSFSTIIFYILVISLSADLYLNHKDLNPSVDSNTYNMTHTDLKPVIEDRDIFRVYVDQDSIHLDSKKDSIYRHHLMWQVMLFPNLGVLRSIDQVNGTTGLELRYQFIITEILKKPWEDKIDFLKLANVKYIISFTDLTAMDSLKNKLERINTSVYRIKDFLPRAWIVGALQPIKEATLNGLVRPDFDYVNSAVTQGSIIDRYNTPHYQGVNRITYLSNNRIEIDVDAEAPGILILSESSYPGWKVFIDGKEKWKTKKKYF